MLKFKIVPVTPFQQNCTILWCDETGQAAVVDPGGDVAHILAAIRSAGVDPVKILLTHGHMDHVGGTAELVERLALPVEGPHRDDDFLLQSLAQQSRMFGVPEVESFTTGRWLGGRRRRKARRGGAASHPLPRPHAGPRHLLRPGIQTGPSRRRAVSGLDRTHRFSPRKSRRPVALDSQAPVPARRRRAVHTGSRTYVQLGRRAPRQSLRRRRLRRQGIRLSPNRLALQIYLGNQYILRFPESGPDLCFNTCNTSDLSDE